MLMKENETGGNAFMSTPHIKAEKGDFAKTVLMPGDPLRSKFIAETFLEDAVLVNNVRGVQGYTGIYQGKRVSVMASGMGMPAIGIYSYELYNFFDVDNIIRIGTAGMINPGLRVRDIVAGMSAYTDSSFAEQYGFRGSMAPCCSWDLLNRTMLSANGLGLKVVPGAIYSSDVFYDEANRMEVLRKMGVLACEMEAAALYLNAARAGKNALCLLTITDDPVNGIALTPEERQTSLKNMIQVALESA